MDRWRGDHKPGRAWSVATRCPASRKVSASRSRRTSPEPARSTQLVTSPLQPYAAGRTPAAKNSASFVGIEPRLEATSGKSKMPQSIHCNHDGMSSWRAAAMDTRAAGIPARTTASRHASNCCDKTSRCVAGPASQAARASASIASGA